MEGRSGRSVSLTCLVIIVQIALRAGYKGEWYSGSRPWPDPAVYPVWCASQSNNVQRPSHVSGGRGREVVISYV